MNDIAGSQPTLNGAHSWFFETIRECEKCGGKNIFCEWHIITCGCM